MNLVRYWRIVLVSYSTNFETFGPSFLSANLVLGYRNLYYCTSRLLRYGFFFVRCFFPLWGGAMRVACISQLPPMTGGQCVTIDLGRCSPNFLRCSMYTFEPCAMWCCPLVPSSSQMLRMYSQCLLLYIVRCFLSFLLSFSPSLNTTIRNTMWFLILWSWIITRWWISLLRWKTVQWPGYIPETCACERR